MFFTFISALIVMDLIVIRPNIINVFLVATCTQIDQLPVDFFFLLFSEDSG